MSVSQLWMHVLLSDKDANHIHPHFVRAEQESPPDATERALFAEWEADPGSILPRAVPGGIDANKLVQFHSRFNLRPFYELGKRLVSGSNEIVTLTRENVPSVVYTRNITPVSILYF